MTLILEDLTHSYGDQKTLEGVNLKVAKGEIVSLLGPSGCGKTTLLRLIAGLERLESGTIRLEDELLASAEHHPPPEKRPVGLVFQEHALFPSMSVADNIEFGIGKLERGERASRRGRLLDMVGLAGIEERKPGTLSGGQQQRVALARALAPAPAVMLLDEPYASVDVMLRRDLREAARHLLKQAGSASILVTHDPDEALEMSDRIAVMGHGRILQAGTPEQIIENPLAPEVAQLFGEAQTIEGVMKDGCLHTAHGCIEIPGGTAPSMKDKPFTLVVRPSGVRFIPDPDGEFEVYDLRYRSSGRLLLVSGKGGDALSFIRVALDHGDTSELGACGRLEVLDRNAFLFAKKG